MEIMTILLRLVGGQLPTATVLLRVASRRAESAPGWIGVGSAPAKQVPGVPSRFFSSAVLGCLRFLKWLLEGMFPWSTRYPLI